MGVMGSRMDWQLQWVPEELLNRRNPDFDDTEELFWDALAWLQWGVDDG